MGEIINQEQVISFIAEQSNKLGREVALEGPPLYLWPYEPTQQWNHPALTQGWRLTDAIRGEVVTLSERAKVWHYLLVDEYNYRPPDSADISLLDGIRMIAETSPQIGELPIISSIPNGNSRYEHLIHTESEFLRARGVNSCAVLDSRFQILKLTSALHRHYENTKENGGLSQLPDRRTDLMSALEPLPLLVMIHPIEFQAQQAAMLTELLGRMRERPYLDDFYQRVPSKSRRKLIEGTYLHVWMGGSGEIDSVTSPLWSNPANRFVHQERGLCLN